MRWGPVMEGGTISRRGIAFSGPGCGRRLMEPCPSEPDRVQEDTVRAQLIALGAAASLLSLAASASPLHSDPNCGQWSIASASNGNGVGGGMPALWDPVNGRVLRFGVGDQAQYAPLFQFTIADGWSQVTPSNLGPFNGRIGSGFVYDSQRNRMLVIGGGDWKG